MAPTTACVWKDASIRYRQHILHRNTHAQSHLYLLQEGDSIYVNGKRKYDHTIRVLAQTLEENMLLLETEGLTIEVFL
jgi:hypothetical protein